MSTRLRQATIDTVIARLAPETDQTLTVAHDDLHTIAPTFTAAVHRLMDARRTGLAAASYDTDAVHGGAAELTQTERLANTPDPAGKAIARLDDAIRHLDVLTRTPIVAQVQAADVARHALTVRRIIEANAPHIASDRDRREVTRANIVVEPGCEHHARQHIHEPIHATGTVSGNLPHPMALCEGCYDQVRRKGRLPDADWIEARHRRGKAPLERAGA